MSILNNWPPTRNESAPKLDNRIKRAIEGVARIPDTGKPVFRIIWPQEEPHCLRYRVNVITKTKLGSPVLNSLGGIESLGQVYEPGDPAAPPGAQVLEQRIIIGVPRWIIEFAQPVTEEQWERIRYQRIIPDDPLTEVDIRGPYPADGLLYDVLGDEGQGMILMHKEHKDGCPQPHGASWFGCCYGRYREPRWRDVDAVQAIWRNFQIARAQIGGDYGFREEANSHQQSWGAKMDASELFMDKQKHQARIEDDAAQILTPFSIDRLVRGGDGTPADMQRFIDLGSPTTSARDNQSRGKHARNQQQSETV